MSWYEYKPERPTYRPGPVDASAADAGAFLKLVIPIVGIVVFVGLFVLALVT